MKHLCSQSCRNRTANCEVPNNSMLLVIPNRKGVHTPLSAVSVPSLEGGNRGALGPDCSRVHRFVRPIEPGHECVDDDLQERLLHTESTNGPGYFALIGVFEGVHLHRPDRLLEFGVADFNHRERLKWQDWRRGTFRG
jgi:hypothetical protein